jgi:hypothetical protein
MMGGFVNLYLGVSTGRMYMPTFQKTVVLVVLVLLDITAVFNVRA